MHQNHLENLTSKNSTKMTVYLPSPPLLRLYSSERLTSFLTGVIKSTDVIPNVLKVKRKKIKRRKSVKPRTDSLVSKVNTQKAKNLDALPEITEFPRRSRIYKLYL